MIVPSHKVLSGMRRELSVAFPGPHAEGSVGQALTSSVRALEVRERGGTSFVQSRLEALEVLIGQLTSLPFNTPAWKSGLRDLQAQLPQARRHACLQELEAAHTEVLTATERLMTDMIANPSLTIGDRTQLLEMLSTWEIADRRALTTLPNEGEEIDTTITQEKLERYLQQRFSEPAMKVTKFQPLAGGFGKQTILLEVDGKALSGSLVLRRDIGTPSVGNDCHWVREEYRVIRAAFERGFPAPEALWLDTQHALLPGGDFIVMRRAAGETGGNVFRSKGAVSDELFKALAEGMARLHTMPPCVELGDLTSSIRTEEWKLTIPQSVKRYIEEWLGIYLRETHNPSPTLVSLYGWLLANVPRADGNPVLLHGDIGFHNMLVEEGRLSVVVDWEFAHVGDPAEDLGYVKNIIGDADWDKLMRFYRAAGGAEVDPVRLHFFQVWAHVRNASASNLALGAFEAGKHDNLKLVHSGHFHFPLFTKTACELIAAGPHGKIKAVDY